MKGQVAILEPRELLECAASHIITEPSVPDSATELAAINLRYGLAKIHWVQKALGHSADAVFVAAPDMTTPRQITKWNWGLAVGGTLCWGDGDRELVFLDLQVSTSAALVGGLNDEPDLRQLVSRVHRLRRKPPTIMGVESDWGLDSGNRFLNAYRVCHATDHSLQPYVFILHGGDAEVKRPSKLGIGLDYEKSRPLRDLMRLLETPLGQVRVLTGQAARDFHAMYLRYEQYSKEKLLTTAEEILGRFQPISCEVHHGFADMNTAVLACYRFKSGQGTLYPITLSPDLPAYLVRGRSNIDSERLPCRDLPEKVRKRVHAANVLPHGGGCTYPQIRRVRDVLSFDHERYYVLDSLCGGSRIVQGVAALPVVHRGLEVMERVHEWNLADVVVELQPLFSLTT